MKIAFTLAAVALAFASFVSASRDGTAPAPHTITHHLKQVTREQVAVRGLRAARNLSERQLPGPSAVAGPCGTTLGSRFVVRATGTSPTSTFTSARPGYLYADPTVRFNTFVPFARLTSDLNAASIFTLDEANGCALTDITNGGAAVRTSFSAATGAQSVTIEGTNAQALSSGFDFLPYQCTADVTGLMSCRLSTVALNAYTYSPGTSAGVTNAFLATCTRGAACTFGSLVSFQVISI